MNNVDRSSDNWYDGMDSEELCVDADIYFDDLDVDPKRYNNQEMHRLLIAIIDLDVDQFKLLQYRILVPHYSLDKIAALEGQAKSNIWKRIRALCAAHPHFASMFKHYDIPTTIETVKKEKQPALKQELDFIKKKKSNLLKECNQRIKEIQREIDNGL